MTLIKKGFPNWPNLSDFFDDDWVKFKFMNEYWMPAVNIVDNDDSYEIELAAPGMKKDDFNVVVNNGVLTIKGKTQKEEEEKDKNYTRREFSMRSFTKSFTLPENVETEEVAAKYDDGVLRLVLHKAEKALPPKKEVTIE
jgi:HSP20 family protein